MSSREQRVAKNETAAREINERLEAAFEGDPGEQFLPMVCECGHAGCEGAVVMAPEEYSRLRSDPRQFAVVAEHVLADVEQVVDQTDRFVIVAKRDGVAADIAVEDDPR